MSDPFVSGTKGAMITNGFFKWSIIAGLIALLFYNWDPSKFSLTNNKRVVNGVTVYRPYTPRHRAIRRYPYRRSRYTRSFRAMNIVNKIFKAGTTHS